MAYNDFEYTDSEYLMSFEIHLLVYDFCYFF